MDIGSRLQQVSAMIESKHKGPVWPSDWPLRVAMAAGSNGNSFLITSCLFDSTFPCACSPKSQIELTCPFSAYCPEIFMMRLRPTVLLFLVGHITRSSARA